MSIQLRLVRCLSKRLHRFPFSPQAVTLGILSIFLLLGCQIGPFPVLGERQSSDSRKATRSYAARSEILAGEFDYGGVGVVIMPVGPSSDMDDRFRRYCEVYVTALTRDSVVDVPRGRRMITFWPIDGTDVARLLNDMSRSNTSEIAFESGTESECVIAVEKYDSDLARNILDSIRSRSRQLRGRGPYLVAWSPPFSKLSPQSNPLIVDLSPIDVRTEIGRSQAREIFSIWQRDLSRNVSEWNDRTLESSSFRLRIKLSLERLAAVFIEPRYHLSGDAN